MAIEGIIGNGQADLRDWQKRAHESLPLDRRRAVIKWPKRMNEKELRLANYELDVRVQETRVRDAWIQLNEGYKLLAAEFEKEHTTLKGNYERELLRLEREKSCAAFAKDELTPGKHISTNEPPLLKEPNFESGICFQIYHLLRCYCTNRRRPDLRAQAASIPIEKTFPTRTRSLSL